MEQKKFKEISTIFLVTNKISLSLVVNLSRLNPSACLLLTDAEGRSFDFESPHLLLIFLDALNNKELKCYG